MLYRSCMGRCQFAETFNAESRCLIFKLTHYRAVVSLRPSFGPGLTTLHRRALMYPIAISGSRIKVYATSV
jgi:hypothetical protein